MIEENEKNLVEEFKNLPRRIFLDTSVLQNIVHYGEYIFENIEIPADDPIHKVTNGYENIFCLGSIFFVNQRAFFEFAVSENSLIEVSEKEDIHSINYAYEVFNYWVCCTEEYEESSFLSGKGKDILKALKPNKFGYLSEKDKYLIFDAVLLECDAFLTMDLKLCKNYERAKKTLGIKILDPIKYWDLLKPFAALYI
jgi:hypothetical protein